MVSNGTIDHQTVTGELNVAYAVGRPIVARCLRGGGSVATCQYPHAADFSIFIKANFLERLVCFNISNL